LIKRDFPLYAGMIFQIVILFGLISLLYLL